MEQQLEEQIIGTLLRHPESVARVDLHPDHFAVPFCAIAFSAMRSAVSGGLVPDMFAVSERMPQQGEDIALGRLTELWRDAASHPDNLPSLCERLHKLARGRALALLLDKARGSLEEGKDSDKVAARLLERLAGLGGDDRRHSLNARQLMQVTFDYLAEISEAMQDGGLVGVPSGVGPLDELLGGFHPSDLVILAARPKMGKTAAMMTFARNAILRGKRVGIASAEMPAVQLGLRLVSMVSDVSSSTLRACRMTDSDYRRLTDASTAIANMPLMVYDKPGCSPADIALQAKAWQLSGGLDILFVDYLTRLQPDEQEDSRTREVGKMVSSLKTLAKTLNIPVICLAQLSRECEKRADKRPMLSDLRDSGEIEQEADVVAFLYRDAVYNDSADPEAAEIIVEANRHGPPGTINARFIADRMLWTADLSEEWRATA